MKRFLTTQEAADYVGGNTIFKALVRDRLLKPVISSKKLTRYDIKSLDAACDAMVLELPKSLRDRPPA